MREIKFRAWDNTTKEMLQLQKMSFKTSKCMPYGGNIEFEFDSLMQYTGLKDKSGKEIYEGDILSIEIKDKTIKDKIIVSGNTVVEYKNCKFGVVWGWHRDFICLDGFYNTDFKIKGNIYGNPELLEG
ncbi:hypothetical protein CF088_16205 [Clostridium botulinum]|uniref:YopX family protein n=1 Tax=Clostridium botulinum TaxID=1491 RepID=UPI0007744F79|nr:YopX family protein [Clostridium botulinum]APH21396.1 hypothetical protein NPD1_2870 [Clostridium botulinum]APQ69679.1 hypothetical protein RSJ8_996 [Clostridium botulinum]MBN3380005.1 hypothetical protein [Clostridium botulinum]MBN3406781.1 hypothetical protein [Clostridium botulinum]QDY17034.1 hypothetical protein CGQ27_07990 [Clostridium botulinum]